MKREAADQVRMIDYIHGDMTDASLRAFRTSAKPLISVIVPTRNRHRLLTQALESVYAQEGIGDLFDVEVIVVDDASTDLTSHIVRHYPGVRYFKLESNMGAAAARNVGIKACGGKYVALLDDDDLFLPHRLRSHVPLMEAQPELGVVYGQARITQDGRVTVNAWPETAPSGNVFTTFVTLTDDFILPATTLVRRDLFDTAGLFDESLPTMEHYDMFVRLAFHAPWLFVPRVVAEGRFSPTGKWLTNILNGNNARALHVIIQRALALLPSGGEYDQVREQAWVSVCTTIAEHYWRNADHCRVHDHLLEMLQDYPWLITKPKVTEHVRRVARAIAMGSPSPVADMRTVMEELWAIQRRCMLPGWWQRRRLLGVLMAEAGTALGRRAIRVGIASLAPLVKFFHMG